MSPQRRAIQLEIRIKRAFEVSALDQCLTDIAELRRLRLYGRTSLPLQLLHTPVASFLGLCKCEGASNDVGLGQVLIQELNSLTAVAGILKQRRAKRQVDRKLRIPHRVGG